MEDYKITFTTSLRISSIKKLKEFKTKHGIKKTNELLDFLLSNLDTKISKEDILLLTEF